MPDGRDEEFSTAEDSDGDGFDDYDEELTGHDPDSKPTQEEVLEHRSKYFEQGAKYLE